MTIKPNTEEYERELVIAESGFREYDARWLFPEQLNLRGIQALGMGIGTLMHEQGVTPPAIVVGHDYRSYSASIKNALMVGLMATGCQVRVYWFGSFLLLLISRNLNWIALLLPW